MRPSAKDLLLNDLIPRKADEVALDELLKFSFANRQTMNYKKIIKAMFEQKNTIVDDVSFDSTNYSKVFISKIFNSQNKFYNW